MNLRASFRDPPSAFRQAPFWFWNHDLDKKQLSWQIRQMAAKGLGGFVMHARHGLITPYLSDAWFDCIRHCCEEAKEHGLIPWAYDERDWPSGPAGGAVIEDHANRLSYLRLDETRELTDGEEAVAWYGAAGQVDGPDGATHVAMRFECPAILWFESYLDTLNPEACQDFIASTYDFHEEKLGDLKALGLAGFFTDEPALSTYPDDLARIPWTASLPEAFREAKGYDLLERLPDFFAPGTAGAQVRFDYWDLATSLFEEAFFRPIGTWCEDRGLQLIGHPLGEEPLFFQFRCLGNIFKYLKHQHMPGMDHLGLTIGKGTPLSMTPKLVASAALLAGRERTMTETFGESGWGLTLREMKWICDCQMVHGINYIIPHAFYYSVAGRRKKDSPPSEFYQAPHWPYYRVLADYTARVTTAMSGGEHVAKVALFFPMSSVWADFVPGADIPESVQAMESTFAPLGEMLLALHRDFVIVDEDSLAQAEVQEDGFSLCGQHFEALVLPKTTWIRSAALDALRRIAQAVRVVAVDTERLNVLDSAGDAVALEGMAAVPAGDVAALEAALAAVVPDVRMDNAPNVYYLHRRKEGLDLYFLANTAQEAVDTTLSLECVGAASVWDPETGEDTALPGQRVEGGRLTAPIHLEAAGSLLVAVDPAKGVPAADAAPFCAEQRLPVCEGLWHFTAYNGNFVALKRWRMTTEMQHKITELRYATEFDVTEDLASLRLILDGVPEHPAGVPAAARSLMAAETYNQILADGVPVNGEAPWEIDPHFRVVDLHACCEPGHHRLEIVIRNHGWFPQPGIEEYAWLVGDFMLDQSDGLPRLTPCRGVKAGPWEKQGFPHFSGTAAYAADVEMPAHAAGKRVFLEVENVGALLEVEVNGETAGVRAWPPYRVELTPHLWPGQSNLIILKVTNTARNLFEGPDPDRPSGLLGDAWLEIG